MARDYARIVVTCIVCEGTGYVNRKPCPECGGNREVGRIGTLEEVATFAATWLELRKARTI
jgi:DnaJ-class molecular chaperone